MISASVAAAFLRIPLIGAFSFRSQQSFPLALRKHSSSKRFFGGGGTSARSNSSSSKNGDNQDEERTSSRYTLERIAAELSKGQFQNVIVVAGAGVSCSAGIPDFRTPGTGLYSRLEDYNLPYPEAIFELDYFADDPAPFVSVASEIWPGQENGPRPTVAHSFMALLQQKGILKRVYSQNIDGLEKAAGVAPERLVECHGHFRSCSCIKCRAPGDIEACRESYLIHKTAHKCTKCGSLVKPDVVFFGEGMPDLFVCNIDDDMDVCDLLIVMGSSLAVHPVASIPTWVDNITMPRLLINRECANVFWHNKNDPCYVFEKGDCDDGARRLCQLAGWEKELDELYAACH